MTRDERERSEGFTNIATDDDCEYHLLITEYENVLKHWMSAKAFVWGHSVYLEDVTIKCARIVSITKITAASMALRIRNEKERLEKEAEKELYDH